MQDLASKNPANHHVSPRQFVRDVLIYSLSTIFVLAMGVLQTFIVPLWMSIDQYGYWRLFFLYVGYAGVMTLGLTDGLLLRWSRTGLDGDPTREVQTAVTVLTVQQVFLLFVIGGIVVTFSPETTWLTLLTLLGIIGVNLMTLGRYHLQASIQFRKASTANVVSATGFIVLIAGVYLLQRELSALDVIIAFLLATFGTAVWMLRQPLLSRRWRISPRKGGRLTHYGIANTRLGFFVLLSNMGLLLVYTLDRMIVSWRFSIDEFAIYGLAVSLVAIVYRIISATSDVLFPYLARLGANKQAVLYRDGKVLVLALGGVALGIYFVMAPIILRYLPAYSASNAISRVLLLSGGFGATLRLLQVNYFKLHNKQFSFFISGAAVNLLFLIVAWFVAGRMSMVHVALVGVSANLLWFVINDWYICRMLRISPASVLFSLVFAGSFALPYVFLSQNDTSLLEGIIYFGWCGVLLGGVALINRSQLATLRRALNRA